MPLCLCASVPLCLKPAVAFGGWIERVPSARALLRVQAERAERKKREWAEQLRIKQVGLPIAPSVPLFLCASVPLCLCAFVPPCLCA